VDLSIGVSCRGIVAPGGWAAVFRTGRRGRWDLAGSAPRTTSNILLLQAAIEGLTSLERPCNVTLYTNSDYLGKGASQWVHAWQRNGWRTQSRGAVKNRELWEALLVASARHHIDWRVVKGQTLPDDLQEARKRAAAGAALAAERDLGT